MNQLPESGAPDAEGETWVRGPLEFKTLHVLVGRVRDMYEIFYDPCARPTIDERSKLAILLEAAPELLEAARLALALMEATDHDDYFDQHKVDEAHDKLKAAIAKATGAR